MPFASTLSPALLGLGTGLSLIIAIGAQNAYLLRLGIVAGRGLVLLAVLQCALSDAVLIAAGTLGVGAVITRAPEALVVVRLVGAAFLIGYGAMAARRALSRRSETLTVTDASTGAPATGIRIGTVLSAVAAFTWLNPHVYLDTVLFLGSVANQQGPAERWWWVGGAVCASFVWFFALGFGARLLRPFFARPLSWRILDGLIAVVMVVLGARLALGA